jgi:hypothetical protein
MARYPAAAWRPLPEADREPLITATQVILHTAVAKASSLYGYFSRADVTVESHFYVNQTGVEQYVDTARQADANRNANVRAISIESWDNADPEHTPWTETQMDLLVDLVAWSCRTHGIPVVKCAGPNGPGIGWHSMWGAPSPWTPVPGKTCPGGPRIAQMPELIARVRALVNEEEEDVALTEEEHKVLYSLNNQVVNAVLPKLNALAGAVASIEVGDDLDEQQVAQLVLSGLSAQAIADALDDSIAAEVADLLSARLAS